MSRSLSNPERSHHAVAGMVALLEADPDLGAALTEKEFGELRSQAVLPAVTLEPGTFTFAELGRSDLVRGEVHGMLIVAGRITMGVAIAHRQCLRVLDVGDLILFDGHETDSIPAHWTWAALCATQVGLFDERLFVLGQRWPRLLSGILHRAAQQTRQAFLQQAISQLPRVEDRLLALFWSLADRRGVARPDGVFLELSVTHEVIAALIGARRPTVSLGLTALAEQGLLRAELDGWLLDRRSLEAFPEPLS